MAPLRRMATRMLRCVTEARHRGGILKGIGTFDFFSLTSLLNIVFSHGEEKNSFASVYDTDNMFLPVQVNPATSISSSPPTHPR